MSLEQNLRVKELVLTWVEKLGKREATKRLVNRHISVFTADRLVHGKYKSTPRDMLTAVLLSEMAKDGIAFTEAA